MTVVTVVMVYLDPGQRAKNENQRGAPADVTVVTFVMVYPNPGQRTKSENQGLRASGRDGGDGGDDVSGFGATAENRGAHEAGEVRGALLRPALADNPWTGGRAIPGSPSAYPAALPSGLASGTSVWMR